jgi:hypothetical protein
MLFLWLLALLITALMTGPVTVLNALMPDGPWSYLVPLLAFVAVEAVLTTQWLMRPQQRQLSHFQYRLAEGVFLLLTVRLLTWIIGGINPTGAVLLEYWLNPISFLDATFVLYTITVLITWQESAFLARLWLRLPLDEGEQMTLSDRSSLSPLDNDRRLRHSDRAALSGQFFTHWVYGGVVLLVCTALVSLDVAELAEPFSLRTLNRLGVPPLLLTALLVYLLVGLWLYSQTRWQVLKVRWSVARTTIQPGLEQTWSRSVGWLIAGVALAAAFLPIGSTFGIARILQFIVFIIVGLAQLLVFLVIFLLNLPLLLLNEPGGNEPELIEPLNLTPPELALPTPPPSGPNLLANGLFWLVLIALTVVAIIFFWRERGFSLGGGSLNQWWQALLAMWRAWWSGFRGRVTTLAQALQRGREPDTAVTPSPWGFLHLNALSPREQIRYFYLAAVRRAGEKGVERGKAETPLEFAQDLQKTWPEAEAEISELTDAFLQARYTPQPITPEDVGPVKRTWKRIKASLRRRAN